MTNKQEKRAGCNDTNTVLNTTHFVDQAKKGLSEGLQKLQGMTTSTKIHAFQCQT